MHHLSPFNESTRPWAGRVLARYWSSALIFTRGIARQAAWLPGIAAFLDGQPAGLVTCRLAGAECEIVRLDSLVEGVAMGSALISAVIELTWQQDCRRDWLITTNDNLDALRFYQKHDFYLMALYTNALEASHKFKRGIPITGMMASRCAMSLSWSILYNSWCEADRFAQNNGTPPFASAQRKYHLINGEWLALRKNQGRA